MPEEKEVPSKELAPPIVVHKDWIRAGFFSAMGVALLALLALILWQVMGAAFQIALPFVVGTMLALLLNPIVDRLENSGIRRVASVALVYGIFVLIMGVLGSLIVPALSNQVGQLSTNGPTYIAKLQSSTNDFLAHHRRIFNYRLPPNFNALLSQLTGKVSTGLSNSTGKIGEFLLGSITMLLDTIIILIVTFYLLLDLNRFRARLLFLTPERGRRLVRVFAHDIGRVFSEYLRGLLIVSIVYGVLTLVLLLGLSLVHKEVAQYALLVGVAGGLLYVVPYLGPIVTAMITFLVTFAAGGVGFGGIAVLLTLVMTQIFDNIITPRIVGGGVGLHPVVSLFALSLGGTMFGIWGLLLSVPIAASIQAILFRLFPRLTTPTPESFLKEQGVAATEEKSSKVLEGDLPDISGDVPRAS